MPESFFEEHRESFEKLVRALPARRVIRDYTLAKYLESKPNRFVDFVLPRALLKLFYPNGNTSLQMKTSERVALAVMLGAWLAAPRITHALRTRLVEQPQPTPTFTPSPAPSPRCCPVLRRPLSRQCRGAN
jgi:hypothetical protein